MFSEIKRNRIIKNYLSKLEIGNNFNTSFIVKDVSKFVQYPLFSVDKYSKLVYVQKEQLLREFGVLDDEIIGTLLKHYNIENYNIEKW